MCWVHYSHSRLIYRIFRSPAPRNVHNLMGWVQKYEKISNEKVRFPFSCTLSMYSKNENFFDTSPLICLIHLVQQASNDTMTQ